jgi:hypothetical protein
VKICLLLLSGFLLFLISGSIRADDSLNLVMVIIDQISLDNIISVSTPNLDILQNLGASGLMNVRTAGHLQPESTYLTAGAGNRCQGSKNIHISYRDNQGVRLQGINQLIFLNQQSDYQSQPGLTGHIFRNNGVSVGLIGNTDTLKGEDHTIVSMVMDEEGYVPLADISSILLEKVNKPWGYQTDWEMMKSMFSQYRTQVNTLYIETGDPGRIEKYAAEIDGERLARAREEALKRIDTFIGFLLNELDFNNTTLGIIIPTPPLDAQERGYYLSLALFTGKDYEHGWLSSQSTRRKGIITISDLLPTLMLTNRILNVNSQGKPVNVIKEGVSWGDLILMNERITTTNNLRPFFVQGFILIQLLVLIMVIGKPIWRKIDSICIINRIVEYLLLTSLLIPVDYLLLSGFLPVELRKILLLLLIILFAQLYFLLKYIDCRLKRVLIIVVVLLLMIIIDLFTGYHLMADSLLGYSSIIGARYYGLGNEYMGLFVGGVLISSGLLLELYGDRRWLVAISYILMSYLSGAANLGANFGGMITASVAGGISYLHLQKGKGRYRILFCIFLLLSLIVFLDFKGITGPGSHIGQALQRLLKGDLDSITALIYRKVNMNLKLLRWTIWTRVLIGFIISLIFLVRYPVARLRDFFANRSYLAASFYGALSGTVITMFVNDSGVVAAATILFYPMMSLLYFIDS